MNNANLTNYVQQRRAAGINDDAIRRSLLAKGWHPDEIDEALGLRLAALSVGPSARPQRMRSKIALMLALAGITGVYALWQVFGTNTSAAAVLPLSAATQQPAQTQSQPQQSTTVHNATEPSSAPSSNTAPSQTATAPAAPPKPKGQYADGIYTGSVANAYYGNVQVQAIIQGGKIANVKFLQYPYTHSASMYINQQAMPYLTQEAIQAQSANVSGVSGATFTSEAFAQSLSSALNKAKNA